MREEHGRKVRIATKVKATLVALVAASVAMALGSAAAQAAPSAGQPFNASFSHVGLSVAITGISEIDQLILTPESKDTDDNPLPPLELHGQYKDGAGNFVLPKATGLEFPEISINVGDDTDPVPLGASIGLAEDATGNYDESTGKLDFHAKLSLILEIADLGVVMPSLNGDLKCRVAPLDIAFSTDSKWPHDGARFADRANLKEGAVSGAFLYAPDSQEIGGSMGSMCPTLGSLISPVGGVWLGNYATTRTSMPPATGPKPAPGKCEAPTPVGTYPDCQAKPVPKAGKKAKITRVTVGKVKVKAGKKAKITIKVTNKGGAAFSGKVALKSSNKQVKIAKSVKVKVAAGKTKAVKVVVKTTKKAKGKAKITATVAKKKGTGTVTVQKAKKK